MQVCRLIEPDGVMVPETLSQHCQAAMMLWQTCFGCPRSPEERWYSRQISGTSGRSDIFPSAFCLLPSAFCLFNFCLLLSAFCLLPAW